VFDLIINKEPSPLPNETDPDLVHLINLMLSKDPDLRPNIYKVMEMIVIHDIVKKFIEQ
jgi:serine/threonine protein kinase